MNNSSSIRTSNTASKKSNSVKILKAMSKRGMLETTNQITSNSSFIQIFCCLVIVVFICIAIGHYAFKNGMLTCDHYILNTYLYVILAVVLVILLVLLNDKWGIFNQLLDFFFYSNTMPIVSFLVLLVFILGLSYAIITVPPQNIIASNAVWLLLVLLITFLLIPTLYFGRVAGVVGIAGLLTVAIVIITGLLGYYYDDELVRFDWDYYLHTALWILIGVLFIGMFVSWSADGLVNFIYVTSIIGLVIFVLLLLSYHKKLRENAALCIDGKVIPNYPLESWQLIIKIANVLADMIRILGINKMRR